MYQLFDSSPCRPPRFLGLLLCQLEHLPRRFGLMLGQTSRLHDLLLGLLLLGLLLRPCQLLRLPGLLRLTELPKAATTCRKMCCQSRG